MKYAAVCGLLLVVAGIGCGGLTTNPDFGPYPAGGLGGLTAGIASFINTGGGTQFTLVIFNADDANAHEVTVTVDGGATTTLDIPSCDYAAVLVSCSANNVVITETGQGAATITVQPNFANCQNVEVYITTEGGSVTLSTDVPTQTGCTEVPTP